MKKILSAFLVLLFSVFLVSCVIDREETFYKVDFYEGDNFLNTIEYLEGSLVELDDILNPNRYEIEKLIDKETGEVWNFSNQINKNIKLDVIFIIDYNNVYYDLLFLDNDIVIKELSIKRNETIKISDIPIKDGYLFDYLIDLKTNEKFDINTKITSDLNLLVKYILDDEDAIRRVTLKNEGETIKIIELKHNELIELSDIPLEQGFRILSIIDMETNLEFDLTTAVTKDLILNIIYEEIIYLVSFKVGKKLHQSFEIKGGNNLLDKVILDPIHEGYEFIGWYYEKTNNKFDKSAVITNNIIIEAQFKQKITASLNYDIYYLNDTHGAVLKEDKQIGLSYISNFIKNDADLNSIFITGGDMFQGQLISNDNRGALMIEVLNAMSLDAFIIGNHEFDWGLDLILEYFNPESNGVKANFPLLGANIIDIRTGNRPKFIDSHTIIEKHGVKIGIIGVIGDGQESSILRPRVENYQFTSALNAVKETHALIKDEVDFIVVSSHDGGGYDNSFYTSFNEPVVNLEKVSAITHAHNHFVYSGHTRNNQGNYIPYIQSGTKGEQLGKIKLSFKYINNKLVFNEGNAKNYNDNSDEFNYFETSDPAVDFMIKKYYKDVERLYNEVLLIADGYLGVDDLANYIARLMMETSGAVAGFQNSGGTRAPIESHKAITAADLIKVFPFDNKIFVAEISGSTLKKLLTNSSFYRANTINMSDINNNNYYKVATNDYVLYSYWDFSDAINIVEIGDMYETWYQVMLNLRAAGEKYFNTSSPIIY